MKSHPKSEGTRRIKKPCSLSSQIYPGLLILEFLVVWREEEEEEKEGWGEGGIEGGKRRGGSCHSLGQATCSQIQP